MSSCPTYAVLLAGGSGTRFWPASRRALPKQFLPIAGSRSMLRTTYDRLAGLVPPEQVLVVCGTDHARLVQEQLPELPRRNLLAEPIGRNTLACIALASFEIERRAPDSLQIVLPADHIIEPSTRLRTSLQAALELAAAEETLVLFGIQPTFAATGYGYVEAGAELARWRSCGARRVQCFIEKPERARAEEFLARGGFLWNSGIFVWRTSTVRRALFEFAPDVAKALERADPQHLEAIYPRLPALPIDVAVMERAKNVCVLPIDYAWSDVGSWPALADVLPADPQGNICAGPGQSIVEDARNCIVHSEQAGLIALIGVQDLIVVQAGGATLVCPRERAQDVKKIVAQLEGQSPQWL